MDGVAKEFVRGRRWQVWLIHRLAEKKPEFGAVGPKRRGWRKGQVELKAAGQQKDSIDRRSARQVEQVNRVELCDNLMCPVFEYLWQGYIIRDGEGQVEIRPAITAVERQRADNGARDDTCVRGS